MKKLLIVAVILCAGCTEASVSRVLRSGVDVRPDRTPELIAAIKESRPPDRTDEVLNALESLKGAGNVPAAPEAEVATPASGPSRMFVNVYAPSWCSPCMGKCYQMQADVPQAFPIEFRFVHDVAQFPDWLKTRSLWSNPVLVWEDKTSPTGYRQQEGWSGLDNFMRAMAAGTNSRQTTATVQAQGYATQPSQYFYSWAPQTRASNVLMYSSREWGTHRKWDGDLRDHMRNIHGIDASGMDDFSAVAYHDQLMDGAVMSRGEFRRMLRYGHP